MASSLLSDVNALYASIPAFINDAPATTPPVTAPAPDAIKPAPLIPAACEPSNPEKPPIEVDVSLLPNEAIFPITPVPFVAEPRNEPTSEVPVSAFFPNSPFPTLAAPFPKLINGFAIFPKSNAEKSEDKPALSPPGSSLLALENKFFKPSPSLSITAPASNPCEKPFAKEAPIDTPSSMVSDMLIPSSVIKPNFKPEPIPLPISFAILANVAFPVVFHHSENGCAINSSHKICTFPKKFAFCHSFVSAISLNLRFIYSIFLSTQSIKRSSPSSIAGIKSVSHLAIPLT